MFMQAPCPSMLGSVKVECDKTYQILRLEK